jgi:hypothetical protein
MGRVTPQAPAPPPRPYEVRPRPQRPSRLTNNGPARCYYCGAIESRCKCYPSWWRRILDWLKGETNGQRKRI